MAESRGVAQGSGAEPVACIDGSAAVEQPGRDIDAIFVDGREQRQRHFDRADLRLDSFIAETDIAARLGFSGAGKRDGVCRGDGRKREVQSEVAGQAVSPGSSIGEAAGYKRGMPASRCQEIARY
jgi:hypothetical protein